MKIKVSDLIVLYQSLGALNGRSRIIRRNNQDEVSPPEPYKIDGETQLAIAININILKPLVDAISTSEQGALKAVSETGTIKDGTKEAFIYQDKLREIHAAEQDVKLHKLDLSKLKLDENQIPPTVIAGLMPILKYEEPKVAEE